VNTIKSVHNISGQAHYCLYIVPICPCKCRYMECYNITKKVC